LGVSQGPATPIFVVRRDMHLRAGESKVQCMIRRLPLPRGRYYLWAGISDTAGRELLPWHPAAEFDAIGPDLDSPPRGVVLLAPVHVDATWRLGAE